MSPKLILLLGLLRLGLPGLFTLTLLLFVELAPGLGEAARSSSSKATFADALRLTGCYQGVSEAGSIRSVFCG